MKRLRPVVERVFECRNLVGESPVWDALHQRLYWVDIAQGLLYKGNPINGNYSSIKVAQTIGCVDLFSPTSLIAAAAQGIHEIIRDADPFDIAPHTSLKYQMPQMPALQRFNDGKVGPDGKLWVGTVDPSPDRGFTGTLCSYACDDTTRIEHTGFKVPNGIAWSPDGHQMMMSDSGAGRVWRADFDPDEGLVSAPSLWLEWDKTWMGMPDGAAVDAEGCYWSCGIFAGLIHRFSPQGHLIESYEMPFSQPTMCCFGGADLRTLYVTAMTFKLTPGQLKAQNLAGSVCAFRVDTPGLTRNRRTIV
jgi:sugar lactone lactonase YvrE